MLKHQKLLMLNFHINQRKHYCHQVMNFTQSETLMFSVSNNSPEFYKEKFKTHSVEFILIIHKISTEFINVHKN